MATVSVSQFAGDMPYRWFTPLKSRHVVARAECDTPWHCPRASVRRHAVQVSIPTEATPALPLATLGDAAQWHPVQVSPRTD
jgi:hypothetical protein